MKASMKAIPLEQFTIEITPPETRSSMLAISLYEDGKFNMNGKLSQILGGKSINIKFTPDCKNICLQEAKDASIKFPKNGSLKLPELHRYYFSSTRQKALLSPRSSSSCESRQYGAVFFSCFRYIFSLLK